MDSRFRENDTTLAMLLKTLLCVTSFRNIDTDAKGEAAEITMLFLNIFYKFTIEYLDTK